MFNWEIKLAQTLFDANAYRKKPVRTLLRSTLGLMNDRKVFGKSGVLRVLDQDEIHEVVQKRCLRKKTHGAINGIANHTIAFDGLQALELREIRDFET